MTVFSLFFSTSRHCNFHKWVFIVSFFIILLICQYFVDNKPTRTLTAGYKVYHAALVPQGIFYRLIGGHWMHCMAKGDTTNRKCSENWNVISGFFLFYFLWLWYPGTSCLKNNPVQHGPDILFNNNNNNIYSDKIFRIHIKNILII